MTREEVEHPHVISSNLNNIALEIYYENHQIKIPVLNIKEISIFFEENGL